MVERGLMERKLVKEIGALAKELSQTIAVAESATGGMISSLLTDISGSSDYFRGGVVAYHNDVKVCVLGVDEETLSSYGAVSSETAAEMAVGVRSVVGADIGVSDTGIAGPTGSTPGKPVGLFYVGLAVMDGARTEQHQFDGNRPQNRSSAAQAVLTMLRDYLLEIKASIREEKRVVTCFLEHEGKICLLRRSLSVSTYKGAWAGVSGYLEPGNKPLEQAMIEMWEEVHLGADDVELVKEGEPLAAVDKQLGMKWIVHPFHFRVKEQDKIHIDWEHSELRWVDPKDIGMYPTVPRLLEAWQRVSIV
jgi:PncC family amidohydrolase